MESDHKKKFFLLNVLKLLDISYLGIIIVWVNVLFVLLFENRYCRAITTGQEKYLVFDGQGRINTLKQ